MRLQIRTLYEGQSTNIALEGFFSGVCSQMIFQIGRVCEGNVAYIAHVRYLGQYSTLRLPVTAASVVNVFRRRSKQRLPIPSRYILIEINRVEELRVVGQGVLVHLNKLIYEGILHYGPRWGSARDDRFPHNNLMEDLLV